MLRKLLRALLRGAAIYFGVVICILTFKVISESENDRFELLIFFCTGILFLIYGFGGNAGVRKIFPWLASAASKNIKFNTNSDLTKMPNQATKSDYSNCLVKH